MIRGLFPRLFGNFREGGFMVGQFEASNSGATLTPTDNCFAGLTASGDAGQYVVTLAGGARKLTVVGQPHVSLVDEDDPTDAVNVYVNEEDGINASAGTIPLTVISIEGTQAVADIPDGAVLTIHLYADK